MRARRARPRARPFLRPMTRARAGPPPASPLMIPRDETLSPLERTLCDGVVPVRVHLATYGQLDLGPFLHEDWMVQLRPGCEALLTSPGRPIAWTSRCGRSGALALLPRVERHVPSAFWQLLDQWISCSVWAARLGRACYCLMSLCSPPPRFRLLGGDSGAGPFTGRLARVLGGSRASKEQHQSGGPQHGQAPQQKKLHRSTAHPHPDGGPSTLVPTATRGAAAVHRACLGHRWPSALGLGGGRRWWPP